MKYLQKSLHREIDTVIHLASRLQAEQLDYRPLGNQRSIRELLIYLSMCGYRGLQGIIGDKWDGAFQQVQESGFSLDAYALVQQRQKDKIDAWFSRPDLPHLGRLHWGEEVDLRMAVVEVPLKWLTAYRMNLFLWTKESGAHTLDRSDCWRKWA